MSLGKYMCSLTKITVCVCVSAVGLGKNDIMNCALTVCGQDTSEQALMLSLFRVGIHHCQKDQQSGFRV